ncbi:LNX2 protein, partial [Polypterus senegalus]
MTELQGPALQTPIQLCPDCGQNHLVPENHLYDYKEEVDDELTCHICLQPLLDPLDTPCGHTYCYQCLENFLQEQDFCPVDRQKLHLQQCRKSSLLVRNLLDKLSVVCPFTKDCGHVMQRCELGPHLQNSQSYEIAKFDKTCVLGCDVKAKVLRMLATVYLEWDIEKYQDKAISAITLANEAEKYQESLQWYNYSLNFYSPGQLDKNLGKLQRNRASCYLQLQQMEMANEAIKESERCDPESIFTQFSIYKIAVLENCEERAYICLAHFCYENKISKENYIKGVPYVVFGQLVIPTNTPRPPDGALPAVWRYPEDQHGVMDYVVFVHNPAGYYRGRKRELQGGTKTHLCPITRKCVKGRATCFRSEKKDSYLIRK